MNIIVVGELLENAIEKHEALYRKYNDDSDSLKYLEGQIDAYRKILGLMNKDTGKLD